MATSSITKNFVVRDEKAFKRLLKEEKALPARNTVVKNSTSLSEGREALKQFLSR